jgi:hypothetical protein
MPLIEKGNIEMTSRIRILGVALAFIGLLFVGAGAFAYVKAQEGTASLQAFSEKQNVKLAYNDQGQLGGDNPEEAAGIMSLLVDDWKYPIVQGDLDPNDPMVNTATEYMYQMATINYHVLTGTQTVVLTEDAKAADGTTVKAGTYEFAVDGRYYSEFDRSNPIEGAARGQAWSGTALGLIGQLGVGTTTASALQLALALAGLFAAVGLLAMFTGLGLVWASRQPMPVLVESVSPATITPTGAMSVSEDPR